MNIFVLDLDPETAARYHCDRHNIKMILESAQLLATAHHLTSSSYLPQYRPTHRNHPCAKWVRESLDNYEWCCELGLQLCYEYTRRYGRIHKTQAVLEELQRHLPPIPSLGLTPFAQAMPEQYRHQDPVSAYRSYYMGEKVRIAKWAHSDPPPWWPR